MSKVDYIFFNLEKFVKFRLISLIYYITSFINSTHLLQSLLKIYK